jgi:hypothetical protein
MRLTSTLHAAGAALGLLAGLSINHPVDAAPLAGEVMPYEVAVVWKRSPAPGPEAPAAAGVQADDWGGRLPPQPAAKPSPERKRAPAVRRAPRPPRPSTRHLAEHAPAPPAVLGAELPSTSVVNRDACSRGRLARLAVESARAAANTEELKARRLLGIVEGV